jgi:hypothetical protein
VLLARSWQAATTAANSAGEGGFPLASCHPRISEDALDGTTTSLATHAAKLNRIKKATARIRSPGMNPQTRLSSGPAPGYFFTQLCSRRI